jgi:hypothetical protein
VVWPGIENALFVLITSEFFVWGKPEGMNYLEDPVVDGRIILKWIFENWDGEHGLDRSGAG